MRDGAPAFTQALENFPVHMNSQLFTNLCSVCAPHACKFVFLCVQEE